MTVEPQESASTNAEIIQYPYDISVRYVPNRRYVVVTTAGDMQRGAIDTWFDACKQIIDTWPAERKLFAVFVLGPSQGYTPYSSKRSEELYRYISAERQAYIAISVKHNVITRIFQFFFEIELARRYPNIKLKVFGLPEEAETWMLARLAEEETKT